jgi:hypothetical protein
VVIQADKNLGPCILEREIYIKRALTEHLLDKNTYKQLTLNERNDKVIHLKFLLEKFIEEYKKKLDKGDIKFLKQTSTVIDPLPKFYLTAKVHKTPWKTRPIISLSGSLLHGLGQWTDKILQSVTRDLPSFVASAADLKKLLEELPELPDNATMGTCDAVSMYTNIDTKHALAEIRKVIRINNKITKNEKQAVLHALEIIMRNNVFEFGDTFWLQIDGTAMGVSPSCCYATIYFSPHENYIKSKYPELYFLKRYIDDIIYIWIPLQDPTEDTHRWNEFKKDMNCFGKLRWEFNLRAKQQNFLDMTITLMTNGKFTTSLYEKPENKYLYLPSHSTHPPGNLKGLIYGSINRIIRLTTDPTEQKVAINQLYTRLLHRGYGHNMLREIINKTYTSVSSNTQSTKHCTTEVDMNSTIILHMNYHPSDPSSKAIQSVFREDVLEPPGLRTLPTLRNHKNHEIGINRLLVAYHRPPNIGSLLSPRLMKADNGPLVSSYID